MIKKIGQLYKDAYSGLPREAWILSAAQFINRSGFMVLFFLNIYLTQKMGFSLGKAGQVIGAFGAGAFAGSYLGGWLCERMGKFRIMKLSLIVSGIFLIIAGYATIFPVMFLLVFLYGVASASFNPAFDTGISQYCRGEMRAKGYALRRLASNLGITISPIIGGYLVLIDYHLLFWVDGLTSIAAVFYLHACFRKDAGAKAIRKREGITSLSPWKDRYFLVFLGLFLSLMTVFAQLFSTFPLYLYNVYKIAENRIGSLLAINTIIIVLFEMVLLHSIRKQPMMRMILLGSLLIGAGYAFLPLGRGFLFAGFTVVLWTFGEMLVLPLSTTAVANRAGASIGRYMGMYSSMHSLAMLISPVAGNAVYGKWGGNILCMSIGFIGLVCGVGFYLIKKKWG